MMIKKKLFFRIAAAVLVWVLTAGLFVFTSFAYSASDFDETQFIKTGNQRTDIVSVAATQIGYHEGNNHDQKSGLSNGSYNYTKYSSVGGTNAKWDMRFVVWCARKAGIDASSGLLDTTYNAGIGTTNNRADIELKNPDSYTPLKGDLVFFNSDYTRGTWSGEYTKRGRVGIVAKQYGSVVVTIEGDSSNAVEVKTYDLSDESIIGYGVPSYTGGGVGAETTGKYTIVNYSAKTKLFVNVDYTKDGLLYYIYGGKLCSVSPNDAIYLGTNNRRVTALSVMTMPSKTVYAVGEQLSGAGLSIGVSYSDGSSAVLKEGYSFTGSTSKLGNTNALVSYCGAVVSVPITVSQNGSSVPNSSIKSISVYSMPTKTVYRVGESFSPDGMVLAVTLVDGDVTYVSKGFSCQADLSAAGTKTVTVTYGGASTTLNVTVNSNVVSVSSISIATMPTKTAYVIGEQLDTTGLTLSVVNADGTTSTVSEGFSVSCDLTTIGQKTAIVVYGGRMTTFNITVDLSVPVTIEIDTLPTRVIYYQGEAIDTAGLTVNANMSDGSKVPVNIADCTVKCDTSRAGNVHAVVTYKDCTAEFIVSVTALAVDKLEVKTLPNRLEYFVNEGFSPKGLVITATYNSGAVEDIVAEENKDVKYTYDFSHSGKTGVSVVFGGRSCNVEIEVLSVSVDKLELVSPAKKRVFGVGEQLDTDGLVLLATYSNGTTREITKADFEADCQMSTLGEQTVTVTYGGQKYKYTVLISNDPENEVYDAPSEPTVAGLSAADDDGNIFSSGSLRWFLILFIVLLVAGGVILFVILNRRNKAAEIFEAPEAAALDSVIGDGGAENGTGELSDSDMIIQAQNAVLDSNEPGELPDTGDILDSNAVLFDGSEKEAEFQEQRSVELSGEDDVFAFEEGTQKKKEHKKVFRRKNKDNTPDVPHFPIEDEDDR